MVAILDPLAVTSVRMTVDEYLEADLPEGYRYELVEGVIEVSPTPGVLHDDVIGHLNTMLVNYMQAHPDVIAHISFRSSIAIPGKETVREPDISVYRHWTAVSDQKLEWKNRTPFLAVEVVSPGQEFRDYEQKRADYLAAGLSEYWIVDRYTGSISALTRAGEAWVEAEHRAGDTFEPAALPGLRVDVARVLGQKS